MVRRQRGQGLVEFALVAPVMLVVLLVLLDFGRVIFYSSQMSEAAREAARQATLQYNQGCNDCVSARPGVPGVVPIIRQLASFGFTITYKDATALDTPPSYGQPYQPPACAPCAQPGTIALTKAAAVNTVHVFVYELSSDGTAAFDGRPGVPRAGGHKLVVVDLKMKFQPVVLSLLPGAAGGYITLDAQSVQREEF